MLHSTLKDAIDAHFVEIITQPAELCQDAVLVHLHNGVVIELRIASPQDYVIAWRWGESELRIDTAPLHPQLATYPNHFHDCESQLLPDRLTDPTRDPWANVCAVLTALNIDPLLRSHRN